MIFMLVISTFTSYYIFSLANTVMSHEDPKSIIALAAGGFKKKI